MIYVVDTARKIVWEAGRDKITEVVALLKNDAYLFCLSYVVTRDAGMFRRTNPEFMHYRMVETLEEFIEGGKPQEKTENCA